MRKFEDRAETIGMRLTADGYLVGEVRCARAGIQQYLASEIGVPGAGLVNVYRPESAVFDRASMATFAGKPVTLHHPPEMVTAENWKKYAVGDIGEDIVRDGDFIRVPIKLMDADIIKEVQNGTREISMGYTCDIRVEDGITPDGQPYQAVQEGPIRINHLAIVPRARGGSSLRIGDGADSWGISPVLTVPTRDHRKETVMSNLQKVVIDGLTIETTDQGAQAIEKLKKELGDSHVKNENLSEEIRNKDTQIGELTVQLQQAKDAANIDVDALVAARTELVAQVKAIDAAIEVSGKTDAQLRKEAVVKKLGDSAVAGANDDQIAGMFRVLAAQKPSNPVADALKQGVTQVGDAAAQMNDAHRKSVNDLNAWRYQ